MSSGVNYVCNIMTASSYFYSAGNIYAVGDVYSSYSDVRLKYRLSPIGSAGEIVDQLYGVTYWQNELGDKLTGRSKPKRQVGLLAQDVERVLPEAVALAGFDLDENGISKSGEDYLTIDYTKIIPVLVEAIKELRLEIRELRDQK